MKNDIDIVVMWVDGDDPEWQKEKAKYIVSKDADATVYRYRDWGFLRYWFRGIDKYAPWVRKVHFVTWGHTPEWLDTMNPKLNIVRHEDFIPKKYLPTFSANTIENNIHRIKGLSEKFILFNDDFYLIKDTSPEDFFKDGMPMDTIALNVSCPQRSLTSRFFDINNTAIVNDNFNFHESLSKNKSKWICPKNGVNALARYFILKRCPRFPGFWQHHLASSYLKETFEEVWKKETDVLNATCMHKFRGPSDVNQWLFKDWQIAKGDIEIRSSRFGRAYYIDRDGVDRIQDEVAKYIVGQKGKMIAINDGEMSNAAMSKFMKKLNDSFSRILPDKCSFEKEGYGE